MRLDELCATNLEFFENCGIIFVSIIQSMGVKNYIMYIKREKYLQKLRPFYEVDLIKVLTGVRRCGKSILLTQIEEEFLAKGVDESHIIKVNFEDIQVENGRVLSEAELWEELDAI